MRNSLAAGDSCIGEFYRSSQPVFREKVPPEE